MQPIMCPLPSWHMNVVDRFIYEESCSPSVSRPPLLGPACGQELFFR